MEVCVELRVWPHPKLAAEAKGLVRNDSTQDRRKQAWS